MRLKSWFVMVVVGLLGCSKQRAAPPAPVPAPVRPVASSPSPPPVSPPVAATEPPPAAPPTAPPADLNAEAGAAWEKREARPSLDEAIERWEKQLGQNPNDLAAATNLARAYYYQADSAMVRASNGDAILDMYEKGINAGERALIAASPELQARVKAGGKIEEALRFVPPSAQGALYWYATNLGRYAIGRGFTTMLFYRERIFAVMQRVLSIDENFYYGAPHRYFGAYYAKLPAFAGGDLKKAKEHFEKAQQINGDFFGTKVLLAENYAARTEDRALFQKILTEVVNGDATKLADVIPEQRLEQEKAKRLLARIDELF